MNRQTRIIILSFLLFLGAEETYCQESIFNGLKSDSKRADSFYSNKVYKNALDLYLSAEARKNSDKQLNLKIARTYFQLKEYANSSLWYGKYAEISNKLSDNDIYMYAEALRSTGEYKKAVAYYKRYQIIKPDDKTIVEKIWRLSNLQYLLEDSIHYAIKKVSFNTAGSEYSPVYYNEGLVFVANKKALGGIVKIDGTNNTQFKTLYFAEIQKDTIDGVTGNSYINIKEFGKEVTSKYNTGPITFFPGGEKMIFTKNSEYNQEQGSRLQLFIAEYKDDIWQVVNPMPLNSMTYSVSDPTLNEDGSILYFVSDMPGGFGNKDIYVSYYKNNNWSKPENLGDEINTPGEEGYPYLHNSMLYFSSNGHGGLGGLDVYKINSKKIATMDLVNLGYPVNSSFDDFGIALNAMGTNGFISSNRENGGFDDDIYEIEIDLQSYPLTIRGTVKYKELSWRDSQQNELLKNAELLLIDSNKKLQVGKSKTDSLGNFEIEIPYASNYTLKIISSVIGEKRVKLEVPQNRRPDSVHDIVIVKNKLDVKNDDSENLN